MAKASKKVKEALSQSAEWGDETAGRALADIHEEEGPGATPGFPTAEELTPKPGQWLMIFTGAFHHNGQLIAENHEYYWLEAGSAQVFDTGDFKTFYGEGTCKYCEEVPVIDAIRKATVTKISQWPFDRVVTQRKS